MNANSTVRKTRGSPTTPRQIDPPTSGETQMATIVLVHGTRVPERLMGSSVTLVFIVV